MNLSLSKHARIDLRYPLGLCLLGLCLYSGIVGSQRGYYVPKVLADPLKFTGVELRLGYVRVVKILPQGFYVEQRGVKILVKVSENPGQGWTVQKEQLRVGDYVSLRAVFYPQGYLSLQKIHIHKGRRLKIWVSVFALLVLAGMLIHDRRKAPLRDA